MPTQFDNIPLELRELKQWILWRYEDKGGKKPTKVPYTINHTLASVTAISDWSNYSDTVAVYQFGGYDGIGFVFTKNDPYAFIDLDDTSVEIDVQRQMKVFNEFNSYSEVSPSGKGLHIIVKGAIPQGRRRNSIEIYSSERYATMTGNVQANKPIREYNELLNQLFQQMGGPPVSYNGHNLNLPESENDAKILEMVSTASNSDKAILLLKGEWSNYYQSQSEADFALIDIIAFYTQNRNQISRIFRNSELGRRDKAKRKDYVEWMINKSFDRQLPQIDVDGFRIALENKIANTEAGSYNGSTVAFDATSEGSIPSPASNGPVAQSVEPAAHNGLVASSNLAGTTILPPPGLVGEIAQFIYSASPRPIPEVSIAAAIGLMAAICGKAYNFEDTGLNQYIMCLAKTGRGKEALSSGIDKIINAVSMLVPVASEFVGPAEIASGQALLKYISNKSPCFVSVLGEFGLRLQAMCDPRSNGAEKTLQKTLLQLYQKSGHGQVLRSSIYADKDKNTNDVLAPAFSILAEGTPQTVYEIADESMILSGLLPRFIIIEYEGDRQLLNKNRNVQPDEWLVKKIADLMSFAKTLMANRAVRHVSINQETANLLDEYDKFTTRKINSKDAHEAIIELWNRAHIKVIKLASIVAIGIDMDNPIITKDIFNWSKDIVERSIYTLAKKFETGQVGHSSNEIRQINDLKRIMKQYFTSDYDRYKNLNYVNQAMHSAKIIPYKFLSQRVSNVKSYKDGKIRSTEFLNKVLKVMLDSGSIKEINKIQVEKYDVNQRAFSISDSRMFDDIVD